FERLDRLCCRILHPLENDQSIPWRHNAIVQDLEVRADAKALYLRFNQPLGRLEQALLHLTDAHREWARMHQAPLDRQLAEEGCLREAGTAIRDLVTSFSGRRERCSRPSSLHFSVRL